jgi:hypothetical protein
MILGDVEETITSVEIDDETYEEIIRVRSSFARLRTHVLACARLRSLAPWPLCYAHADADADAAHVV